MYKFFINDKPLIICAEKPIEPRFQELKTFAYSGKEKLLESVRKVEEPNAIGGFILCDDPTTVSLELKSHFTSIHASGGIVFNSKKQLLLMKRLGKWDLPKGKIDPGETAEEGAKREVEEECGINKLSIKRYFGDTFHTYKLQGHRFLKVSHWYLMDTAFNGVLVPQIEESISEVKWEDYENVNPETLDTYESIRELLFELKESQI
jgi:ADP-ribose pyrophosphatase YjhB (NUDIX family)